MSGTTEIVAKHLSVFSLLLLFSGCSGGFFGTPGSVATIEALQHLNLSFSREGRTVLVAGYRTNADGGGGIFVYSAASVAPADGGMVIAPREGKGRWLRIANGPLNVRWFGATGKGRIPDHEAINSALAYLKRSGGGVLYLPAGIYLITDHVYADFSNLRVTGDGVGATTIKVGAWVDGFRVSNKEYPLTSATISAVTIENLSIDGNREGYERGPNDTYGNGINLNSVQNFFVKNVHVYDTAEQGIVSTFFGPSGTEVQAQASICDTLVDMTADYGRIAIGFEGHFARCIAMGNRVRTSKGGIGIYFGNEGENRANGENVCVGNVIAGESTGIGIRADRSWRSLTATANVIQGFAIGVRIDNHGEAESAGCSIVGNQIGAFADYGVVTSPSNGVDRRTTVSANTLVSLLEPKAGALLGRGSIFTGNTVTVRPGAAIGVIAEAKCLVSSNVINSSGVMISYISSNREDETATGNLIVDEEAVVPR